MKINIDWLRDFVAVDTGAGELADMLTMAGLEVDSVTPAAAPVEGVVVAEILEKRAHPDADRLSVCVVSDGEASHEIVCGAPNASAGIKVPLAPVGTRLPGGHKIRAAKIRGVRSSGMLCSAKELELADDADGLLVLDSNAEVGQPLAEYLRLDDHVLDVDLTPNRGDCFSILGIAREIAARQGKPPLDESQDCIAEGSDETWEIELIDTQACARFAGRVIRGLSKTARSPDWLRERLRRAGLRAIHPVVDVTNYVMLELGQPLHAYRLDRLQGPIQARFARQGEALTLLDESELTLDSDALVIADDSGAIGLAGIMGGLSTAVDADTDTIFLESAFFAPAAIQGRARRYGLHTDASVRFERGVDPGGQERAIERATELLLEITGGTPGPVVVAEDENHLPSRVPVELSASKLGTLLGVDVEPGEVERMLTRLGMVVEPVDEGWLVTPPGFRFDIAIEEDLIEEVGRMVGYDRIPVVATHATVRLGLAAESQIGIDTLGDFLVARGYNEIISYSFTAAEPQTRITGSDAAVPLTNPISHELAVMRTSLWPGLLSTARSNFSRQLARCRLFEIGTVFEPDGDDVVETTRVAALVSGPRQPAHWEGAASGADFYDLKGDLEGLLAHWRTNVAARFEAGAHPALNPSRSAAVYLDERRIGWLGELHPRLQSELDLKHPAVLFEIELNGIGESKLPKYAPYSKYPSSRRDIAVVVDEAVPARDLTEHVVDVLGDSLQRYEIFDLYRGDGIGKGRKSIGIGLILHDASRTLNDAETDAMIERVMRRLEQELGATIRN